MGNCITTPEEEEVITQKCGYKGCNSITPRHYYKYCDTHYKLQVVSTVELEMRLKYADLFQVPCDDGHMFRNWKLYKKIDKRSKLYRKSHYIKMHEADLIEFDKKQKRKKNGIILRR